MKILTRWLRAYLPELPVSDTQLAEDLTLRGIAVEGIYELGDSNGSLFEMDITTNRVDAMNHYGIAREAAAIYGVELKPLEMPLPAHAPAEQVFSVRIDAEDACGRFTARVLRGITITDSRDWFPGTEVDTYFNSSSRRRSPTPSTPPISHGSPWASRPTPSTSTKSKAASWCVAPAKEKNSRPSTE